ncbi:MAG: rod shape-determining protein [Vicinamibacterales bacterium]
MTAWFSGSADFAVDLGTVNTCVLAKSQGVLVREPSLVAFDRTRAHVEAVGREARDLLGRMPDDVVAVKPMRDGVIADTDAVEHMLNHIIRKAHSRAAWRRRRMIVGIPSAITPVDRRAVCETIQKVDAKEVYLVQEPVAAAIGAGIDVLEPRANMVVDIGGGTTDVAVVCGGYVLYSASEKVGGNAMDEAIAHHMRRKHGLAIGEQTAEQIKIEIGSALPLDAPETMEVRGYGLTSGAPKIAMVSDAEIRDALNDSIRRVMDTMVQALGDLPAEVSSDVFERGLILTGGGSLLRNLGLRVRIATQLPVQIAEDPLSSVVVGAGQMFEREELLRRLSTQAA